MNNYAIWDSLENLFNDEDDEVESEVEDVVQPVVPEDGEVLLQGGQVEQPEQLEQREDTEEVKTEVHDQSAEGEQGSQGTQQVMEEVEGEQLQLRDRVSPVVLPPGDIGPCWLAIDRLGVWDSFLCRFPVLEEVPEQHKGTWAAAIGVN